MRTFQRTKLENKAQKLRFVGYSNQSKGYRLEIFIRTEEDEVTIVAVYVDDLIIVTQRPSRKWKT